ncbi:MAG: 5'-methylthioadenosine/S-adenosylhomocysteine nucleosidase [Sphaerochaetaceae bacterium]
MVLVVASSEAELQGARQFPIKRSGVHSLPCGRELAVAPLGVGKINAAINATLAIQYYRPRMVICVGTCGGVNAELEVGDFVLPDKIVQWDVDLSLFGWPKGVLPSKDGSLEGALPLSILCDNYPRWAGRGVRFPLTLGSGDIFSTRAERNKTPWLTDELGIDALDMESYAVAKSGQELGVEVKVVRFVSDNSRGHRPKNYPKFLEAASLDLFALIAQSLTA